MSSFRFFASKPARTVFNQLSDAYQEKKQEEEIEEVELPAGVSEKFYIKYDNLSKSFAGDTSIALGNKQSYDLLIQMIPLANSEEESGLLKELIEMWRRAGRLYTKTKSVTLMNSLLEAEQFDLLFGLLCNQFLYGLKPDSGHITRLIRHFSELSLKEKHIENLDQAYRCFALYLYYDIPPPKSSFHSLIAAGLYGKTTEGLQRSITTSKEMKSLGWPASIESEYAWIYHSILTEDYPEALAIISRIEQTKQTLSFKVEALEKSGEIKLAKEITLALSLMPKEEKSRKWEDIGTKYWINETAAVAE